MWYVREVTETDLYNYMCLYFHFDSICVLSELFELVSLLSQQFHAFKAYILLQNVVSITRYSNADAGADNTFYPLSLFVWRGMNPTTQTRTRAKSPIPDFFEVTKCYI